jgi:hypothetical protein
MRHLSYLDFLDKYNFIKASWASFISLSMQPHHNHLDHLLDNYDLTSATWASFIIFCSLSCSHRVNLNHGEKVHFITILAYFPLSEKVVGCKLEEVQTL